MRRQVRVPGENTVLVELTQDERPASTPVSVHSTAGLSSKESQAFRNGQVGLELASPEERLPLLQST